MFQPLLRFYRHASVQSHGYHIPQVSTLLKILVKEVAEELKAYAEARFQPFLRF